MKPEISIQSAMGLQAQVLTELHHESFGGVAWSLDQIQGSLALPSTQGWIAYSNYEVSGFLLCQMSLPQSEILTFCVRPCYRRQGVGEKLLERALEANRSHGGESLLLEVAADNQAAIALYMKCGFTLTGKRPHYYQRDKEKVDALLLTLTIKPV